MGASESGDFIVSRFPVGQLATAEVGHEAMPHIGHRHHMCHYAGEGNISLEEMKKLVKDPRFICRICGRAAHSDRNLCEPVSL